MTNRERSLWGWGWADKFPNDEGRKNLGTMVAGFLGGADLRLGSLPSIDKLEMPAPRVEVPANLAEFCSSASLDRARHTYGKNYRDICRGFAGDFSVAPDVVARPRNEDDIDAVLDWANGARVAVIPYGGGTSVVGGIEAAIGGGMNGAVSLDMSRLDQVLEVDPLSLSARIQAGVFGPALEGQLAKHGLTLRHFPQSFEFSTLGGWIATRAGGHFATLYTHIDDLVESVRMVTPTGPWESRRLPGSGAGPSPDRMVLGSEGTLGVITEAWMRVRPRPAWRAKANLHFRDWRSAVTAVREIAQSGLYPSNCRLLDAREAMLNGVVADGSSVLLLGFESAVHPLDASMERAVAIATAAGGQCPGGVATNVTDNKSRDNVAGAWKSAFIDAPYLLNTMVSLGIIADTFETACTWDRFDELHDAVIREVRATMKRVCGKGLITCRFTHVYPDGPAPYYTFIAPGTAGGELEQWMEIRKAAADVLIAHGATITHHHAVGRLHRPWYEQQRPDRFEAAMVAAKRELDPSGILNPGVLWATES